MYPDRRFQWTHVGDGPEREKIEALAMSVLPSNVTWRRLDYGGPQALMDFYRGDPIDVFVNTSASEGTPVSIMEAISCGMPVIATSVGGNVEIVGPSNGLLLSANPEPKEIAEAFNRVNELPELRAGSRAKWEADYSARKNYERFATRLLELG
jgi:glycosyltransferase involved in cell wall biosynthesis